VVTSSVNASAPVCASSLKRLVNRSTCEFSMEPWQFFYNSSHESSSALKYQTSGEHDKVNDKLGRGERGFSL